MKIAEGWKRKTLRDLATINYGKSPAQILTEDGLYPVVGTGGNDRLGNNYLYDGDSIILGRKGTIDRVYFATSRFWTIDTAYYLTDFDDSVPRWLYYALQSTDLRQLNEATGVPSLSRDRLYKIEIPTPPRAEQAKVAEILSTVDRAIEQTEALIAKQQRIKTGLMQDLLTCGIDEHGNLRSEKTHKFKDSPLGRIPVEWEVVPISSVLSQPPKNGYSPVEADNWNGIYMLGLGCLTNDGFEPKQLKYAPKANRLTEAAMLQSGDFLISRSNTRALVGLVGVYKDSGDTCIYPDLMMRLRFANIVSTNYMEQVFMSATMRRQIENAATGTSGSMVKISAAIVKGFTFRRPPLQEQLRILLMLQAKAGSLLKTKIALAKLCSLKTALMQDLLTGKRRVTQMLEEAARL